ncbi:MULTISPECIES: DUF2489 domain-containing protein [Halomonadaceae]|uniref:DUF2489 domain-containing protein n=1 Tax=Halomonadaceae TaxID=28256 RepID=UPI00159A7F54|nr:MULTISPECIES: DUF2489 domain-containing protein [Halomonas]QJQ96716.1 DUF2489 domain-containing protein [Halomonas sp. PA5]
MNSTLLIVITVVAVATIIALAVYAWTLWKEVRRRDAFREDEVRRAHEQCLMSLDAIADGMLKDQLNLTEGALRCKVLLEIIDPVLLEREHFQVFAQVHELTQHLHTHSSRKALTPRERFKEDRERLNVESEHEESLKKAAKAVRDFTLHWPKSKY